MLSPRFFITYFAWHYGVALYDLVSFWRNMLWFVARFFSVRILLGTMLAPWRRMNEKYAGVGIDFEAFASMVVVNMLMRVVGLVIRTVTLIIACVCALACLFGAVMTFVAWLSFPALVPALVIAGIFVSVS